MRRFLDAIPVAALQAWLVFCIVADAGTLTLGLFLEGGDISELFRSDIPYIVGVVSGTIAAIGAALHVLTRRVTGRPWIAHATCLAALAL